MKTKMFFIAISTVILVTLSIKTFADTNKLLANIAVVDINLVFNSSTLKKNAKIELQKQKEAFLVDIRKEEITIKELESQFETKKNTLNLIEYRKFLSEIEIKKENLGVLIRNKNKELKILEEGLKRPILKKILDIIEKVRKEKGYAIILNKNDALAYDIKVDLTYEVINRLKNNELEKNSKLLEIKKDNNVIDRIKN
ncbi:MAG: OmpH family outer membrane protein [Spirochaetota bacterium]|nr:OmpH family outer membrane protein [Spirochaetota bacterium]